MSADSRIFVQIPAYRDPELSATLSNLFSKASQPERIHVSVCWQYKEGQEPQRPVVPAPYASQITVSPYPHTESRGVCWARYVAQQAYDGEAFSLMIDSHMRFVQDWDTLLIQEWQKCHDPKAIVTYQPPPYTPPDTLLDNPAPSVLRAHLPSPSGNIRLRSEPLRKSPPAPLQGAFASPATLFSAGVLNEDVPYDPFLYFEQEELCFSARLYTHGWNIFHPTRHFTYHLYDATPVNFSRSKHWDDHPGWIAIHELAQERRDHLLGRQHASKGALEEIDRFGHGDVRSLEDYAEYSGVDFDQLQPAPRALKCEFIPGIGEYLLRSIEIEAEQPHSVGNEMLPKVFSAFEGIPVDRFKPASWDVLAKPVHEPPVPAQPVSSKAPSVVKNNLPAGVLMIENYATPALCKFFMDYSERTIGSKLAVVDAMRTTQNKVETVMSSGRITESVSINGVIQEMQHVFMDIHLHRMAPFYGVTFEWFERPQILRYLAGGKYDPHADADHFDPGSNRWLRVQDRDYSVLLYLNEDYEGGELHFSNLNFTLKPKAGLLVAFPSDLRYLHAAHPTTKGRRYVIVSWSAIVGSPRVLALPPYASNILFTKS